MDNPECGVLDQKNVFGGGWMKKRYRYEEDDYLAQSPPDDTSFLSLRFGHLLHNKPVESMYDRINKELGVSLENPSGPRTPQSSVETSTKNNNEPAELLLGSKGISLENFRSQPHVSEHIFIATGSPCNSPKLLRHPPFVPIIEGTEEKESDSTFELSEGQCVTPFIVPTDHPEKPEDSFVARQDVETLVRKTRGGRPTRKISMNLADTFDGSLLDSVRELKLDATQREPSSSAQPESLTQALPSFAASPAIFDSAPPIILNHNTRDRLRKTSAPPSLNPMLPETQKAQNYFFTGSLFSAVSSSLSMPCSKDSSPTVSHHDLSTTDLLDTSRASSPMREVDSLRDTTHAIGGLAKKTSQVEEKAREVTALEVKPRMGKRRPRASALREMNFWAPQSS